MALDFVSTDQAPAAIGPYSQAVASAGLLYTSGQTGLDPATGSLAAGGFEAQADQAIDNMLAVLAAAGGAPERLARVTVYIVGIENWSRFNAVYASRLPNNRPARTIVPVSELHNGFLVEIDAVAFLDED